MFTKKMMLLVLMSLVFFSGNLYAEETWKITSLNWEPYSGAEIKNQGNAIQKLREVLRSKGIRLVVEFYPWKRSIALAKTSDYVGYFPAWPEEVVDGFTASAAVDLSEIGILKQSGKDIDFKDVNDLFKKYKVGIVKTYTYPKVITDAMAMYPKHVDGSPNEISLLKKLSKGRYDAAITDPNVMMYLAEKQGMSNIEPVKVVMEKELVVAFRNGADNKGKMKTLEELLKK